VSSQDGTSGSGTNNSNLHFSYDGGATWGDWQTLDATGSWTGTLDVGAAGDTLFDIEMQVRDLAGRVSIPITGPAPHSVLGPSSTLVIDLGVTLRSGETCSSTIYWSANKTITWPTEQSFCLIARFVSDSFNGVIGSNVVIGSNGGLSAILMPHDYYTTYQVGPLSPSDTDYLTGPDSPDRVSYDDGNVAFSATGFTPVHERAGNGVTVNLTITSMVAFYDPLDLDNSGNPKLVKFTPVAFPVSGHVVILNSGSISTH